MANNYTVNFELLGSADSLTAALEAAKREMHSSGVALSSDAGQASQQISAVFAQALNKIAQEAKRVNTVLAAETDGLRKRANLVAKGLVPDSKTKAAITKDLLGGEAEFTELRQQLEARLGKALTSSSLKAIKAPELRNLLRETYADLFISSNQSALDATAASSRQALQAQLAGARDAFRKDIKQYINPLKDINYLKGKFPGVFKGAEDRSTIAADKDFLKSGLTGNIKTDFGISDAALKKTDGNIEKVRERGTKLVAVLRRIDDEIALTRERINRRTSGDPANISRNDPLNVYAARLEDSALRVRNALGEYSSALRRRDSIVGALNAPKNLAERGTSIAILSAFEQTKEAVRARRQEVDQLRTQVKNDLAQTYNALKTPGLAQKDEKLLNTRASSYQQQIQALTKLRGVLNQTDDSFKRAESAANQFAASLSDRGISDGKLSATGKSVNQLRRDRKDLRAVQIQIENELKEATTRINRIARQSPEATVLTQAVTQLRGQRQQVRAALSGFSDELGNQLRRSPLARISDYLKFSLLAGGVYQIAASIRQLTREVFAASAEFQRLKTSFTAILAEPVLGEGGAGEKTGLTPTLLNQINRESEQIFKRAQLNAIKTVATTKEYVTTLQSALAVGQQIGLTQAEIEDLTLNFIRAAGAFGIEQEKVGSSIAQIFSGSVRVTNQLARNLGLATKQQRDLLKEAIKSGTLYEFLTAKTRAFAETGKEAEDNFINVSAAIQDIFEVGGARAISPLFDFINSKLVQIRDTFVGTDANTIFKAPLVQILDRIRNTIIQLLPNIAAFTTEAVNLTSTLFRALTGEGIGALKLIFNLLTAILSTLNQIVGGTGNFLSPLVRLVPVLLAAKTGLGLINGALAFTYNSIGKISDAAVTASDKITTFLANRQKNVVQSQAYSGGTGGIATFAPVATSAALAGNAVQTFQQRVQGAVGALQAGIAVVGGVTTVIGTAILAITIIVNLYREYSGAASAAREAELNLQNAINKSIEIVEARIEQGKILTNILKLQAEAQAAASGAENDEQLDKATQQLRAFFTDAELAEIKLGKINDELRAKIVENQLFIAESFTQTSKDLQGLIDTSFAEITSATDQIEANKLNFAFFGPEAYGDETKAIRELTAEQVKAAEIRDQVASRGLAALNLDVEGTKASQEAYESAQAKARELVDALNIVGDVATANTKTYAEQVELIARLTSRQDELIAEQKKLNKQTVEGAKRNAEIGVEYSRLSNQISSLTGNILNNVKAGVLSREDGVKQAEANKQLAQSNLAVAETQLAVNTALIEALKIQRQQDAINAGPVGLDQSVALKYASTIAELEAGVANASQRLAEAKASIAINDGILKSLNTKKSGTAADATKYKATRDVLQDFLTDFNKKLEVIKSINDNILKNEAEINASRKRIRDSLAEGGAISIIELGKAERDAIEEEFDLTKQGIDAQIKFIDSNIDAARALAKKAESNAKVKGAQGDKADLAADTRDREGQAVDELTKKKIDLQAQLVDATRKFEAEISNSVSSEVKKRLDLRQKELDQIPQLVSLLTDAQKTFAQQLAKFNIITAEQLNSVEFESDAADRAARAKRLIQEIFPLADPQVKEFVKDALQEFLDARKAAAEKDPKSSRFTNILSETLELKQLLAQDFPDSVEGATKRIEQFREAAALVIKSLRSEVNFGTFKGEADVIFAKINELSVLEKTYQDALKAGTTEKLNESLAKIPVLKAEIKEANEKLIASVEKTAIEDKALISSYAKLAQVLSDTAFLTPEDERKLQLAYVEEIKANGEAANKQTIFQFEQLQKRLDIELQLLEIEKNRLDFNQQVLQTRKELGLITEAEFRDEQRRIITAQLELNKQNEAVQERRLRQSFASISATGFDKASDDARAKLVEVSNTMVELSQSTNDLNVQLLQLGSVFVDAAEGFDKISSAFDQFPGDSAISKLGPVFKAVENLFRELEKSRLRSQGKELLTTPQTFANLIVKAGADFKLKLEDIGKLLNAKGTEFKTSLTAALDGKEGFVERVKAAGEAFKKAVLPDKPTAIYVDNNDAFGTEQNIDRTKYGYDNGAAARAAAAATTVPPSADDFPIKSFKDRLKSILEAYTKKFGDEFKGRPGETVTAKSSFFGKISGFVTKNIGAILEAVASLVSGFARGGAGGIISGVGGAVSAVGGLFANSSNAILKNLPAVGAIFGVVGGIFDVFAAKAKAKAEAFAKTVGEGIDDIKQAFNDGKISLAEAISQINAQLAGARAKLTSGKTGKKGGNAAFAQLEQQAKEAQEELRRQAEETQKEFLEALNLLRKPAELRDIITQINDARKKAEEFLRSFEDQDGLIGATQQAMEFFRLTIGEIRDGIEKSLKDLRQQLKDAAEQFEKSRRDILLQGRIDPRVSEAENKRKQLLDLEREFRERQKELVDQIATEQTKLDLVNRRAEIEFKIGQYIERSAAALSNAAVALGNVLAGLPGHGGGAGGYGNYGDFLNSPQVGDLIMNNKIEVNVNGSNASAQEIGVAVADHIRLAGRTQHNRQSTGTGNF